MTNLTRWDPFGEMRTALDRLYEDGISRPWRLLGSEMEGTVPVEVSESDDSIQVKAQLPGVKPEDVNVTVSNGMLNIRAEHREDRDEKEKNYVRHEIRYGSMQRTIPLPSGVDVNRAEATFEDGILRLKLGKAEEMMPKRIPIAGTQGQQQISGGESQQRAA